MSTDTPIGTVENGPHGTTYRADRAQLQAWASGGPYDGGQWPCSQLRQCEHVLAVEDPNGDLVELQHPGSDDLPADELQAWTSDVARLALIDAARGVDAGGFDAEYSYSGPGRLDGATDRALTIALDVLVGVGDGDEIGGDVDGPGHGVRFGRFVLLTDSQGFISAETFDREAGAVAFLASLEPAEDEDERPPHPFASGIPGDPRN